MSQGVFNLFLVVLNIGSWVLISRGRPESPKMGLARAALAFAVHLGLYFMLPASLYTTLGTLIVVLSLGVPLFVSIGLLSLVCFYFLTNEYRDFSSYSLVIEKIFGLTDKNVLLAIPFFVVAGTLMTAGGIARKVVAFADALVGWLPGGLAAAAVLSCMFFAAISGSSPVTVIAIGSIMMPALAENGYSERFSLGLVTSAGSLGILIPPSIPMIVYGIVVGGVMAVNVSDLFLAGVLPGLLIGSLLVAYSVYHAATQPGFSWRLLRPPSFRLIAERFVDGLWALLLPLIVLGGIYPILGPRGIFTPTEAAAVAAVYAFVVEVFIHRELTLSRLPSLLVESSVLMGTLLVILVMSFVLNHFLVDQQIPDALVAWMTGLELSRVSFLLVLNIFLLLIGCLMDIMSAILIVAPLVAPIASTFDVHPVHLGIIFVVNLEIGYLTPPIGLNLFVSATLFRQPIGVVARSVLKFTGIMLLGLFLITWWEPLSLGLGRVLSGGPFLGSGPHDSSGQKDVGDPPDPQKPQNSVKSLQELMREAAEDGDEDAGD